MKISYNWLNSIIQTNLSPEKIGELLTGTGLEVENIEPYHSIKGGLIGITVGKVLTCEKHPNADKLSITTVDIGHHEPLHIVCGAPNVAAGQKVLVATVGCTVHPSKGEPFEIKKSKIRGEVSEGMICAEDELSLGESHDGILVLPETVEIGAPATQYFENYSDFLIEIGLTANRGDAASHLGVARDLRAVTNNEIRLSNYQLPKSDQNPLKVTIKDTDCLRYSGISISGVQVKPSPAWLQNRLKVIGISPINNIVDVTNYVMHELGQPLHAFDATKIAGNEIVVQKAAQGTKFTTLDKVERILTGQECMICDAEKPVAIAGVFGGLHSGISAETTTLFIESATFDAASVRKTAKKHGLNTDASFRYERGTDIEMTIKALTRAVELILEVSGGFVSSKLVDVYPTILQPARVNFNIKKFNKLIGQKIGLRTIKKILLALDFSVIDETPEHLLLEVPLYRTDVTREADIAEEVLRIYGLNNIAIPSSVNISINSSIENNQFALRNKISDYLTDNGFNEILNNSITKSAYYHENDLQHAVKLLNPLSNDLDVMRQTLLFNGLEVLQYNRNRRTTDMQVYEFGKTYRKAEHGYAEQQVLAVFITGKKHGESWHNPAKATSYFTLKTVVENLLKKAGIKKYKTALIEEGSLKFQTTISFQQQLLVTFGAVPQPTRQLFDLSEDVWYAEINWDSLCAIGLSGRTNLEPISAFPSVRRDLALVLDKKITFTEIEKIARKTEQQLLKDINVFDVYEGDKIASGKKSYAISFVLQNAEKTLTDDEIEGTMNKLIKQLEKELGATLRS
ncbi:MAG: phenylalanine--tRNA ligase subunit beta [Bacteroidetes bacterium]|nr:MAG: phenylalanine--tRNA ligase subunit beta [Bacteroidota bacterium]